MALARMDNKNLKEVLTEASTEIAAARSAYLDSISLNDMARTQHVGVAAWVLMKFQDELSLFQETQPDPEQRTRRTLLNNLPKS
jgi:hypothetical protein